MIAIIQMGHSFKYRLEEPVAINSCSSDPSMDFKHRRVILGYFSVNPRPISPRRSYLLRALSETIHARLGMRVLGISMKRLVSLANRMLQNFSPFLQSLNLLPQRRNHVHQFSIFLLQYLILLSLFL